MLPLGSKKTESGLELDHRIPSIAKCVPLAGCYPQCPISYSVLVCKPTAPLQPHQ